MENGANPKETIQKLGNALTNKLIHPTTAAIRGAASEDRLDQLDFIQHTYDLQVPTAEDGQAAPEGLGKRRRGILVLLTDSMMSKLESLRDRFEEVAALLSDAEVMADRESFTALSKEYAEIEPVVGCYRRAMQLEANIADNEQLLEEEDPEMRELAQQDIADCRAQLEDLTSELKTLLIPKDPNDQSNVFLEIRAGTGGDEAAIFSGDLFRMYNKFAEQKGWRVEVMNERPGEHGGFKEIITRIEGKNVYSQLKFESGAHRVQRVPETESQAECIPQPAPSRSCRKSMKLTKSISTRKTFAKIPTALQVQAVNTLTRPIPPYV